MTPLSPIFRNNFRVHSHLINGSTIIFMGDWGDTGLELVAEGILYPSGVTKGS
jgi:hypothetical protein